MATMQDTVLTTLQTATASILTGGIFKSDDIDGPSNGGWDWAVEEGLVVSLMLTPHGILRWKDSTEHQADARHIQAEMQTAELFIYADYGQYSVLESVIKPVRDAFPYNKVYQADDRPFYTIIYGGAYGEFPAVEYQNRPSRMIRLQIIHKR